MFGRMEVLTIPPSRAKANIIRLLDVILKRPQCQTQTREAQRIR